MSAANATVNDVLLKICFLRNEASISRSIDCTPEYFVHRRALSNHRANGEKPGFQRVSMILRPASCGGAQRAVRNRTTAKIYEILESGFKKMETGLLTNFAVELSTLAPSTTEVKRFDFGKAIAYLSFRCLKAVSYPLVTAQEKISNTFAGEDL